MIRWTVIFWGLLLVSCASRPPKTIRLPAALSEASGLVIQDSTFTWHNDSGDGPLLYQTNLNGYLVGKTKLSAQARDYEDITSDPAGRFYVGDFGNNAGRNNRQTIYRYDPITGVTDSIRYVYPGQKGEGRDRPGNYDCEAMVYQNGQLHLFTKDQLFGKGRFYTYHYRLPATPGEYTAELIDSLYLPRRVITAAAVDSVRKQLVLTTYNFSLLLGKVPNGAASLITISDYPEGRFFRGKVHRRNLSWFWPTQFEAVDFYDKKWLYVASEATRVRKRAVAKRKRRRK